MNKSTALSLPILALSLIIIGCGGEKGSDASKNSQESTETELTDFEMENGIGPITEVVTVNEIDEELARKGAEVFELKCSACHKLEERYVGPALGDVLEIRTPAYVMNMILNPDEMVKKHPEAKKMLQQFMTPMPNQNITKEEARSIVEYLASDLD